MQKILLMFGLLLLCSRVAYALQVHWIALSVQPAVKESHFIFFLSQKTKGKVQYLPQTHQLVVTLLNTYKNFTLTHVNLGGSNVGSISTQNDNKDVKIIFNLKNAVTWKIHFLPKDSKTQFIKLQLDIKTLSLPTIKKVQGVWHKSNLRDLLSSDLHQTFQQLVQTNKQEKANHKKNVSWVPMKWRVPTDNVPSKKFKIIIDAGHGGKDTGAIGVKGTAEKNIVLSLAKKLVAQINQSPNMQAILTRDKDTFVSLRSRLALARRINADLFIAVHADAFFNNQAQGASVYALSQRGATNEAARWLSKQDNYSELDGVELNTLKDRSPLLRYVLIDLAQTTTIRDSLRLGNRVLDALDRISMLHHNTVEQAPFVVLKSPDIPSILVEVGFISNPREEAKLRNVFYQEKLAQAIKSGIEEYVVRLSKN